MTTIADLRKNLPRVSNPMAMNIRSMKSQKLDYNVYLPSYGINLQRDFCWSIDQKRELIFSIFYGRHILPSAMIRCWNDTYQVIDGKQRISTVIAFHNNEFTVTIDDTECFYSELPADYKLTIDTFYIQYYVLNEEEENQFDDDFKLNWYRFLNFAGTPQEKDHMKKFVKND